MLQNAIKKLLTPLNKTEDFWWLFVRIWLAVVFFRSGLTKIDDFETTVILFAEEYKVPVISPYFAALSGTFFELACPVALVFGIFSRFTAIPLFFMTLVIQFTYLDHVQHYYWAILLFGLIIKGSGRFSLDYLLIKRLQS